MKKLMKVVSMAMVGLFALVPMLNVEAKTEWTAEDWTTADGYGSVSIVDDNITNIKGNEIQDSDGMFHGPFSKKSQAKLADGITEEVYIELNKDDMADHELFELSMALNDATPANVAEVAVMTQKLEGNIVLTAEGWAPEFKAIIDEDGVYTYRYTATVENGETYFEFSILKWDEVIATTGKISKGATGAESIRYMWFCNVQVANGVNVYTTLPEKPVEPEVPVNPVEPETPVEEVKNEEVNPETSDGIVLFLGLTVVGFAGVALTYRRLHN